MKVDNLTKRAIATGRQQAKAVLVVRDKALRKRAAALTKQAALSHVPRSTISPRMLKAAGGPTRGDVLVAEGDSWFKYPGNDILNLLEDEHGFDVEHVAHHGDRIQDMAYNKGQLEEFTRRIERVIRRGDKPKAILLSGGGNDIAGKEFAVLLNHASAPKPGLNIAVVEEIIDRRIRHAYITIITAVTEVCVKRLGHTVPILVHGYDYAVADARGYLWFGPWLEPGFRAKDYQNMEERIAILEHLIDRFNEMLLSVSKLLEFKHVSHVDIRKTLPNDKTYKMWWANELHPTPRGFSLVAQKFADAL